MASNQNLKNKKEYRLNTQETALALNLSVSTIKRRAVKGELNCIRGPGNVWLFHYSYKGVVNPREQTYTTKELSQLLGMHSRSIGRRVKAGLLKVKKNELGNNIYYDLNPDLLALIETNKLELESKESDSLAVAQKQQVKPNLVTKKVAQVIVNKGKELKSADKEVTIKAVVSEINEDADYSYLNTIGVFSSPFLDSTDLMHAKPSKMNFEDNGTSLYGHYSLPEVAYKLNMTLEDVAGLISRGSLAFTLEEEDRFIPVAEFERFVLESKQVNLSNDGRINLPLSKALLPGILYHLFRYQYAKIVYDMVITRYKENFGIKVLALYELVLDHMARLCVKSATNGYKKTANLLLEPNGLEYAANAAIKKL